jgi:multifunctional beta-oxidation protein
MSLSFSGLTVVITGAGGGLGKACVSAVASSQPGLWSNVEPPRYSLHYASRGANVIVNDFNREAAQKVVNEITHGAYDPITKCYLR